MHLLEVIYPALSRDDCRSRVQKVFDDFKVRQPVNSLEVGTVNAFSYWADYFNIHPALLLATMAMEQGAIFSHTDLELTPWQCEALMGDVDRDEAGTARPDLLGIAVQIYRAAMGYSWSLGLTPTAMFGRSNGWHLSWPRFTGGIVKQLDDPGNPVYTPADAVEYALLCHCPHLGRLADAQDKWNVFIPYFQNEVTP